MLRQNDRRAKLPVDLAKGSQKIRRRNRVKLARWFVENQNLRLQDHHGRKIQQLLLSARQLRDRLVEPVLNAEKACHFRHSAADRRRVIAERFQPERQLVPDLIRDDLIFRALLHEADFLGLFALGHFIEILSVKQDLAAPSSMRCKHGFQLPQKRRFPAPGRAAEHQKFSRPDGQREIGDRVLFLFGIRKIQMFDCKEFHCLSSLRSRITGVSTSARYTSIKLTVIGVNAAALIVG